MPERILVTGATGLVGSRFVELHKDKSELLTPTKKELDVTQLDSVKEYIDKYSPNVIINFAAYTKVGLAQQMAMDESNPCTDLNIEGVRNFLFRINPKSTHFIQISTDMTISGSSQDPGPYKESHASEKDPYKLSNYGWSKAQAEDLVNSFEGQTTVLRITYPTRAYHPTRLDYLRTPLELFDQGKLYPVFDNQQIAISHIDEVCNALEIIIKRRVLGTLNVSSRDLTTPYDIISYLIEKARGVKGVVQKSHLEDGVRYPKFGGLDPTFTQDALDTKFRETHEIVDDLVKQGIGIKR